MSMLVDQWIRLRCLSDVSGNRGIQCWSLTREGTLQLALALVLASPALALVLQETHRFLADLTGLQTAAHN